MRNSHFLLVAGLAALAALPVRAQSLGAAQPYNLYVLGNAWQQGADAEGGVAIGGNLQVGSWGFTTGWNGGGKLVVSGDLTNQGHSVHPDGVFVGGNLNYQQTLTSVGGVQVNGNGFLAGGQPGSVKHGGTFAYTGTESFPIAQGTSASPLNFAATSAALLNESSFLSTLTGTAVADVSGTGGYVNLDASGGGLKIFNFSQAAFENTWFLNFAGAAPDSTIVVNVAGQKVAAPNANYLYDWVNYPYTAGIGNVLYNFYEATELHVDSLGGSILAPKATLDFDYGVIYGNVAVGQLGTEADPSVGQFNQRNAYGQDIKFRGRQVPEPGTLILMALGVGTFVSRRRRK